MLEFLRNGAFLAFIPVFFEGAFWLLELSRKDGASELRGSDPDLPGSRSDTPEELPTHHRTRGPMSARTSSTGHFLPPLPPHLVPAPGAASSCWAPASWPRTWPTSWFKSKERSGRMIDGKQEGEWVFRYGSGAS